MVSAKLSCHDITCKSVPGSPPPFQFFGRVRGESGNKAMVSKFPCHTNQVFITTEFLKRPKYQTILLL